MYNPEDDDKLFEQTEKIRLAQERAFASLSKSEQDEQEREMKRLFDKFTEFTRKEEAFEASFHIKDDDESGTSNKIIEHIESDDSSSEYEVTDHDRLLDFYKSVKSMLKDLNIAKATEIFEHAMAKLRDELDPLEDIFKRNIQACNPVCSCDNITAALDQYKPGNILIVVKRTYVVFKDKPCYDKYVKSMLLNSRMARSNYLKKTKHYQILTLDDVQKASIVCSSADMGDIEAIKQYIVTYFKGKIKLDDITFHQTEENHLILDTITGLGHEMMIEVSALLQKLTEDDEDLSRQLSLMPIRGDEKSRRYLKWLLTTKDHTEFGKPCAEYPLGIRPTDHPILIYIDKSSNVNTVNAGRDGIMAVGTEIKQTVQTHKSLKQYVIDNPPHSTQTSTEYRKILEKEIGKSISISDLAKTLKKLGYTSKNNGKHRYWSLEKEDSD